jgi:hypothetical protein
MGVTVVQKQSVRAAERGDEQIEIPVAIDIDKRRAKSVSPFELDAALASDVLEFPVAEVPVERAWTADPGEEDVHQSVAVDISQGNPGAESKVAILEDGVFRHVVDEPNAQLFR